MRRVRRSCSAARIAAVLPDDLPPTLGARGDGRLRRAGADRPRGRASTSSAAAPTVAVIGGAGKSGSLVLAAARDAGAGRTIGVVPARARGRRCSRRRARRRGRRRRRPRPVALRDAVAAAGGPADVTVVCVDVPGCEGGAILATADGGTVIFFSMATSFSAAALGAEGLAADVHDARRQRLRARPRGVRARAAARRRRRARRSSSGGCDGRDDHAAARGKLDLDPATVRKARTLARKAGRPIVDARPAAHHRLRRAGHAAAGRPRRRRPRRHAVGQPAARRRPRRRRPRARRRAARSGTRCVRGEADDLPTLAQKAVGRLGARSGCPRAATPTARPHGRAQGRSARGITPDRRAPRASASG